MKEISTDFVQGLLCWCLRQKWGSLFPSHLSNSLLPPFLSPHFSASALSLNLSLLELLVLFITFSYLLGSLFSTFTASLFLPKNRMTSVYSKESSSVLTPVITFLFPGEFLESCLLCLHLLKALWIGVATLLELFFSKLQVAPPDLSY